MKLFTIHYLSVFAVAFVLVVACRKPACENCPPIGPNPENKFPIAVAGTDQLIFLPADSFQLDGSASTDPDGSIVKWQWRKLSGPASFQMLQPDSATTIVRNLQAGIYQFVLTITDNDNAKASDTLRLEVRLGVFGNPASNVFVVGYISNGTQRIARIATNAVWQNLSDGQSNAEAHTVFVYNNDVYIGGYIGMRAVLWKNGAPELLASGTSGTNSAYKVKVSGGDVYVAGVAGNVATLWKNGVPQSLTDGAHRAAALDLFLADNNVYVAGYNGDTAMVWKNGVAANRFYIDPQVRTLATAITVSDGVVYVTGSTADVWGPVYHYLWKDGVQQVLEDNGGPGYTTSVAVAGTDVYVAGYTEGRGGVIWKNGKVLYRGPNAYNHLFIKESDLYAVGSGPFYSGTVNTATLRKNGEESAIAGLSGANAVFVR